MYDNLAQTATAAASLLALVLSTLNLYLQRRDRSSRLGIRVRYEYRADGNKVKGASGRDAASPRIHDASQERLYLLLGDFLRKHDLEYPQGVPLIRFALSNEGQRPVYLNGLKFTLPRARPWSRSRLVLDPLEEKILPIEFAGGAGILDQRPTAKRPVELLPGDSIGYKFELIRMANTLKEEGHTGNVRLTLEATDRLGNTYRRPFEVSTDLWAYPGEPPRESV